MYATQPIKRIIIPIFVSLCMAVTLSACSGGSSSSGNTQSSPSAPALAPAPAPAPTPTPSPPTPTPTPTPPVSQIPGTPLVEPITVDRSSQTLSVKWHTPGMPGAYWSLLNNETPIYTSETDPASQIRAGSASRIKVTPGVYHLTVNLCDARHECTASSVQQITVTEPGAFPPFFIGYYPVTVEPWYDAYDTQQNLKTDQQINEVSLLAGGVPDYITQVVLGAAQFNKLRNYHGLSHTSNDLAVIGLDVKASSYSLREAIRVLKSTAQQTQANQNEHTQVFLALSGTDAEDWQALTDADKAGLTQLLKDLDLDGVYVDYGMVGNDIAAYHQVIADVRQATPSPLKVILAGWATGADCTQQTMNDEQCVDRVSHWTGNNAGRERQLFRDYPDVTKMVDEIAIMSYGYGVSNYDPMVAYQDYRQIAPDTPVALGVQQAPEAVPPDNGISAMLTVNDAANGQCDNNRVTLDQYGKAPADGSNSYSVARFTTLRSGMMLADMFADDSKMPVCGKGTASPVTDIARGVSKALEIGQDKTTLINYTTAIHYGAKIAWTAGAVIPDQVADKNPLVIPLPPLNLLKTTDKHGQPVTDDTYTYTIAGGAQADDWTIDNNQNLVSRGAPKLGSVQLILQAVSHKMAIVSSQQTFQFTLQPATPGKPLINSSNGDNNTITVQWHTSGNPGSYWELRNAAQQVLYTTDSNNTDNTIISGNTTVSANQGQYQLFINLCNKVDDKPQCTASDAFTVTVLPPKPAVPVINQSGGDAGKLTIHWSSPESQPGAGSWQLKEAQRGVIYQSPPPIDMSNSLRVGEFSQTVAPGSYTVTVVACNSGDICTESAPQTVTVAGPTWSETGNVFHATVGQTAADFKVNLNALVNNPAAGEGLHFTLSNDQSQVLALNEDKAAGITYLTLQAGAVIPVGPDDKQPGAIGTFELSVASSLGGVSDQIAPSLMVTNLPPVWQNVPIEELSLPYDTLSGGAIVLDNYIVDNGKTGLNFTVSKVSGIGSQLDYWQIDHNANGHFYLVRTEAGKEHPTDINQPPVVITVSASNSTSHQPLPQDISVNVIHNTELAAPVWHITANTFDAVVGQTSYADGNTAETYKVNLSSLVTSTAGDKLEFAVNNRTDAAAALTVLPEDAEGMVWLTVPKGTKVPLGPDDSAPATAGTFDITVKSTLSGHEATLEGVDWVIKNLPPTWQNVPTNAITIPYDRTSGGNIVLDDYIVSNGKTGLNFTISHVAGDTDATYWQIEHNADGHFYLVRTQAGKGTPTDLTQIVTITIAATNQTAKQPTLQDIKVQPVASADLPAPQWQVTEGAFNATVGQTSAFDAPTGNVFKVDLNALATSSIAGDTLTFSQPFNVTNRGAILATQSGENGVYWLTVKQNTTVPPGPDDNAPAVAGTFDINVTSALSGHTTTLKSQGWVITNLPPTWQNVPSAAIDLPFNTVSGGTVVLDNYIVNNGKTGLHFTIDQVAGEGTQADYWQIEHNTDGHFYLVRTAKGKDSITDLQQTVTVTVTAGNSTANGVTKQDLNIKVAYDNSLAAPQWTNTTLPAVTVYDPYEQNLTSRVTTPGVPDDRYTFQVNTTSSGWSIEVKDDGNAWLTNKSVPTTGAITLMITATSIYSGKPVEQLFNLTVNNGAPPQWLPGDTAGEMYFDSVKYTPVYNSANYTPGVIDLSALVVGGVAGNPGLKFEIHDNATLEIDDGRYLAQKWPPNRIIGDRKLPITVTNRYGSSTKEYNVIVYSPYTLVKKPGQPVLGSVVLPANTHNDRALVTFTMPMNSYIGDYYALVDKNGNTLVNSGGTYDFDGPDPLKGPESASARELYFDVYDQVKVGDEVAVKVCNMNPATGAPRPNDNCTRSNSTVIATTAAPAEAEALPQEKEPASPRLIGYLKVNKPQPDATELATSGYTHVVLSTGVFSEGTQPNVGAKGSIYFKAWDDAADYIKKLHEANPKLKILLGIGGNTATEPGTTVAFDEAVNDDATANQMLESIKQLVQQYHFDGIDIAIDHGLAPDAYDRFDGQAENQTTPGNISRLAQIIHTLRADANLKAADGSAFSISLSAGSPNISVSNDFNSLDANYAALVMQTHNAINWINIQLYDHEASCGLNGHLYGPDISSFGDYFVAMGANLLETWPRTIANASAICTTPQPYVSYLTPDQIVLGYVAADSDGQADIHAPDYQPLAETSDIKKAVQCLRTGTTGCLDYKPPRAYPDLGGVSGWDISHDAANHYQYAKDLHQCVIGGNCH